MNPPRMTADTPNSPQNQNPAPERPMRPPDPQNRSTAVYVEPSDHGWRNQAACAGAPEAWFFPEVGANQHAARALAVCETCPVLEPCAGWAVINEKRDTGIQGGMTERQRQRARGTATLDYSCATCRNRIRYTPNGKRGGARPVYCPTCYETRRQQTIEDSRLRRRQ